LRSADDLNGVAAIRPIIGVSAAVMPPGGVLFPDRFLLSHAACRVRRCLMCPVQTLRQLALIMPARPRCCGVARYPGFRHRRRRRSGRKHTVSRCRVGRDKRGQDDQQRHHEGAHGWGGPGQQAWGRQLYSTRVTAGADGGHDKIPSL